MKIDITATKLDLTPSIKKYVSEKLAILGRMVAPHEKEGERTVFVEIARSTKHHKHGDVFYAEATLGFPGKTIRAEHFDSDIRIAISEMRDILREEIKKYKEKAEVKIQRKRK